MTISNPVIGTVTCPIPGCSEGCTIKAFRPAPPKPGKIARTPRRAGLLYFDCPTHGRFGFDGKKPMQDYILENAKMYDPEARAAAVEAAKPIPSTAPLPAAAPAAKPAAPAAPAPPAKSRFGFFS